MLIRGDLVDCSSVSEAVASQAGGSQRSPRADSTAAAEERMACPCMVRGDSTAGPGACPHTQVAAEA
eukprot:6180456-Amphidinium_carterae.1